MLVRMSLSRATGYLSQPITLSCVTNCYVICDSGNSFTLLIFYSWATILSVSFSSPFQDTEGSFSFCTYSLVTTGLERLCYTTTISIDHWHVIVLCINYFSHFLSIPFLLDQHTCIATLTLNSTPCFPPVCLSLPSWYLLSSPPLPSFLMFSLQRESQWDWEAEAEQDDCLHHRIVRHGAHLQCTSAETR